MLNNGNRSNCGFEDTIVSYIYDEIETPERRRFESHLVGCSECTDEFAAVSNARFSVFEWHKEEFTHLATPEIVIPYEPRRQVVIENARSGFMAGIRGLFAGLGWAVAAAVCLGLGFAAMTFFDQGGEQLSANASSDKQNVVPVNQRDIPVNDVSREKVMTDIPASVTAVNTEPKVNLPANEPKPLRAMDNRPSKPSRQTTAQTQKVAPQLRKAPVLSNFDDSDDKSLRLSDLFDTEIGTGGSR